MRVNGYFLPESWGAPVDVAALAAKLKSEAPQDPKAWAHKLLKAHDAGDYIPPVSLRAARDALGLSATGRGVESPSPEAP